MSSAKASGLHACCVYDFTLFDEVTVEAVREVLKKYCKQYCFQLEEGEETHRRHYQGRISLMVKKRQSELVKVLAFHWEKFHISITSGANRDNVFYVMKDETRVAGPYTDNNEVFVPWDLMLITKMYTWQEQMIKELSVRKLREVTLLYAPEGGEGKTIMSRVLAVYHDAVLLPSIDNYKDILRMVGSISRKQGMKELYIMDMPRCIPKKKLAQMYAALESLKGGYCYDDRYEGRPMIINPPRILVITNRMPKDKYLTKDRWQVFMIDGQELVSYDAMQKKVKEKQEADELADELRMQAKMYEWKEKIKRMYGSGNKINLSDKYIDVKDYRLDETDMEPDY